MKVLILSLALLMGTAVAHAEETTAEKAEAAAHTAKRKVKKGAHKVQEAVCAEGDATCMAKKAGHRGSEAVETAKDKTKEVGNKID